MADKFDAATRSRIMSNIKGKWTGPERILHNQLKAMKVKHKMHPKIPGKPDALILGSNTVVFIDGCFWHGCPKHGHIPKTKKAYWKPKIERNKRRDKIYSKKLTEMGYDVVRLWEHETKDIAKVISKIL